MSTLIILLLIIPSTALLIIPQRGSRHGSGDTGHTSKQSCQGDGVTGGIKEKEDLGDTEEGDRAQGGWAGP